MHWPGWKLLNCWARHSGERDSFQGTQPAEATRARSCWVRAATILFEHLVASLKIYINYTPTTCAFFLSSAVLFPLLTVDRRNRIFEHPFTLRQSALLNATGVVGASFWAVWRADLLSRRGCEKSRCIIILLLRQQLSHLRRREHTPALVR